ncbi:MULTISPECIES: trypsin-like serine peptidase [Kitasatospora]|uniref:trypsin-like serine peptidase n=1 Tax=Kitasatospora TaxID=2063 RepID=UPI00055C5B63|nr:MULTISPECIES: trypsin-like peptidase domain-containing protein [unclassified Kitasatospora]WAL74131.1 trypsin-like peptidase domain-containing protein [Kitasatospora sp. YST-16]WNW40198.1 trypsin-like peptidase domain-containing protein [Streptomyces sp. Li-HN-5-13]
MTDQHRIARRVRSAAAAALVTVLAVTTAACSQKPVPSPPPVKSSASGSKDSVDIGDLQNFLSQAPNWNADDWKKWASKNGFKPEDIEAIKSFWNKKKPADPKKTTSIAPDEKAPSIRDVVFPSVVQAKAQPHPYGADTAVIGKIFFESDEGTAVCSGTVVADPGNPGRSNLVWTAAHCAHGGKGKGYFTKLMFAPSYNRTGVTSNGKGQNATWEEVAPLGRWLATDMLVMPQWTQEGNLVGTAANQFDFAVIRVASLDGSNISLEETVGSSVPILFNAKPEDITAPKAYGYPAGKPYDGEELEHCDSTAKLTPFVFDRSRPPMLAIGCSMTGGSSGGGWITRQNGKPVLFSNVSIGDNGNRWQAGPTLGPDAKKMFDAFLAKESGNR